MSCTQVCCNELCAPLPLLQQGLSERRYIVQPLLVVVLGEAASPAGVGCDWGGIGVDAVSKVTFTYPRTLPQ